MSNALLEAVVSKINEFSPINQQIISRTLESGTIDDVIIAAKGVLESEGYSVIQYGSGADTYFDIYKSVAANAGNGAATDIVVKSTAALTDVVETETAVSTTLVGTGTGTSLLAMDVGLAGAAIAPALGLLAGVGLYNLAPEFWNGVSERLENAGKLVAGKVQGLFGSDGKTSFDEETIEIYKNAFLEEGLFDVKTELTPDIFVDNYYSLKNILTNNLDFTNFSECVSNSYTAYYPNYANYGVAIVKAIIALFEIVCPITNNEFLQFMIEIPYRYNSIQCSLYHASISTEKYKISKFTSSAGYFEQLDFNTPIRFERIVQNFVLSSTKPQDAYWLIDNVIYVANGQVIYETLSNSLPLIRNYNSANSFLFPAYLSYASEPLQNPAMKITMFNIGNDLYDNTQPNAILPSNDPISSTYPEWTPTIINNTKYYPISIPTDDITQQPSQIGDNPSPEQQDKIVNVIYYPTPDPTPTPTPDTDPQPQPDPQPDIDVTPPSNPINPNPQPTPSDPTPIVPIPTRVDVGSMFRVYNPTASQINSLGNYLWTTNIIDQIKQIWNNPTECILSFHQIFASPVTNGNENIILGYLDSGISSAIVSQQFTTVDCGRIQITESKRNATDYTPFSTGIIYLPFVGMSEVDLNAIMNGELHIVYNIDVYTGTCNALIYCKRNPDMPTEQLLYTFAGNISQRLPLTAGSFASAIGEVLSLAGIGISVASGGSLLAGAIGIAHSLTQDMIHVQHSSSLSANAGMLAPRKPFFILSRQSPYDANGYGGIYGYPANKTVYLGNCSGYLEIKDILLKSNATGAEKEEIVTLLKDGVII